MRNCSCSAAISVGTTCTGTTTRDFICARTTCSDSAARISFSESGAISQKVSVKSNGVWLTAQKLAYVREVSVVSSGMIVKLICFESLMSIFSHDTYHDALHLHLVGLDKDGLHGRIRRLKSDAAVFPIE